MSSSESNNNGETAGDAATAAAPANAAKVSPLKMPSGGAGPTAGGPGTPNASGLPTAPGTPGTPGTPGAHPVPQTPTMQPPPSASAFETDLPPELLQQGWRKFWSRRENRPYFFNRATGDTMWEMPPIHHVSAAGGEGAHNHQPGGPHTPPPPQGFDRVSDPLGINGPPPQHPHHNGPHPHHPHAHPHQPGLGGAKRRPSEEMGGGPAAKRFIVAGPWDLELPTNVILFERKPTMLPHPHPEVEILRASYVMKLRQNFQEMCQSRESECI